MMQRHSHPLLLCSFVLSFLTLLNGCSGSGESTSEWSTEQRYERGIERMNQEDFLGAIIHFETLLLQDPAHELADDAQFQLGEAYFGQEEYYTAAFQYSRVLTEFRGSSYYKRALFMTGECYHELSPRFERDQKRTNQAIKQYEAFLQYFPNDSLAAIAGSRISDLREKLAQRDYTVAESYLNRENYQAAEIYFQRVIDLYADTRFAEDARAGLIAVQNAVAEASDNR